MGERSGKNGRHQSNVMFNIMRGGIPLNEYNICADDFRKHVELSNVAVANDCKAVLGALPDEICRTD